MRRIVIPFLFTTMLLAPWIPAQSQTNWVKSTASPFINSAIEPGVLYDSTQKLFKIWYVSTTDLSVYHAVSFNGTTWLSYPYGSVLARGSSGSIDEGGILGVESVIQVAGGYIMYYSAKGVINGGTDTLRICAATSTNGIDWQKYAGNPVISTGPKGSWDAMAAAGAHVMHEGGSFVMLYVGNDSISHGRTGLALSRDGLRWVKYANNPVLSGDSAAWDVANVSPGGFVKKDSTYYVLYGGTTIPSWGTQAGLATSKDLHTWVKQCNHPVISFGNPGQWDQSWIGGGTLLYLNGKFFYWYCGYSGVWSIGSATSVADPLTALPAAPQGIPERTSLEQNYPNPFNPSTNIEFVMPASGRATLKIFDLRGAEVATLQDGTLPAGRHSYQWNAQGVASGVYFYRLQAAGLSESKKMIVIR
ncbi:MAG TPA: T9SS type A sorting domain-containing protein [Bacteroidota bacterium]|nr:T9SS type A sorting domain-containing protein [Bacteroidota bacterium]